MLKEKKHNNPYLSGNFAPVQDELDAENLTVLGEIPFELQGTYMRNGPNPAFPPIAYHYPFDGDGMIHAVTLNNGKAHYRNRYVKTRELLKEQRAGKALYGSVLHPITLPPQWRDPEDEPIAFKNGAFIHIIRHANTYLALSEAAPAYEMTAELDTKNVWQPTGAQAPLAVSPHARFDPQHKELWFAKYAFEPPHLSFYCINHQGHLVKTLAVQKSFCSMLHDFVLTKNYIIFFDCPIIFDFTSAQILNWRPELGVKIGILSRKTGIIRWLETESFFVFHFVNAYELGHQITIDYVRHAQFYNKNNTTPPQLFRMQIDISTAHLTHIQLDDRLVEFPRIREDCNSQFHQFIYLPTKLRGKNFDGLIKYDTEANSSVLHDFGAECAIDEAVFVPRLQSASEEDGYLMLFVYHKKINESRFVILDANDFSAPPVAEIKIPRRVPHGLHGSWMPL